MIFQLVWYFPTGFRRPKAMPVVTMSRAKIVANKIKNVQ